MKKVIQVIFRDEDKDKELLQKINKEKERKYLKTSTYIREVIIRPFFEQKKKTK